jgi:RNA polymerase sigma-32 factor
VRGLLRKLKNRISAGEDGLLPEQVNYIADQLKVDYHEVVDMNGRMRGDVSLNVPTTGEDASEQLQNWLVDPAPDPESLLSEAEDRNRLRTALKDALAALSPRERHIIGARFLVDQPKTLEELGLTFGVSHERVRQIEVRALQKVRGALRARLEGTLPGSGDLRPPRIPTSSR